MRATTFALLLCLSCTSSASDGSDDEFVACEGSLQLLVVKLEADGEYGDAKRLDGLPGVDSEYSTCLIQAEDTNTQDGVTYFVFRHSDNVTVYVYRARVISSTFVWYGPFYSAYRK